MRARQLMQAICGLLEGEEGEDAIEALVNVLGSTIVGVAEPTDQSAMVGQIAGTVTLGIGGALPQTLATAAHGFQHAPDSLNIAAGRLIDALQLNFEHQKDGPEKAALQHRLIELASINKGVLH